MKILYIIIIILCVSCANTNGIKGVDKDNNVEIEQEDKNIVKSMLFYFWVITGGM